MVKLRAALRSGKAPRAAAVVGSVRKELWGPLLACQCADAWRVGTLNIANPDTLETRPA